MKKYLWILLAAVVLIGGLMLAQNTSPKVTEKQTVKIGLSLPLTGGLAFVGEGARVAVDIAKASFGETKNNYEFIFEDDQFSSEKAANTINKLVRLDKAMAVISFGSITGNVISPVTEQNKTVHFGIASDLGVAKGKYNYIHWTPPFEENKTLISEFQKRGIKKVVLFETNQAGIVALTNDLREKLVGTDIKLVSEQKFNIGEKDFRSYISKVKNLDADIYLLEAASPEIEILTQQIREVGIKTPVTAIESFEFSDRPELFEGQWYVGPAMSSQEFANLYIAKTGKQPTLASPNVYDIVRLIITAAETGKVTNADELVSELDKIKDFKGALGNLNFNSDGVVISKAIIKVIKGGSPVPVN
jgi:branched-chain amino acid transport system substrate-binding protein